MTRPRLVVGVLLTSLLGSCGATPATPQDAGAGSGGAPGTGGAQGSGGTAGTGGAPTTGGASGTGGTPGAGGTSGTGGVGGMVRLPPLHVEGAAIKDPDGKTIVLRGVALIDLGTLYGTRNRAPPASRPASTRSWRWE